MMKGQELKLGKGESMDGIPGSEFLNGFQLASEKRESRDQRAAMKARPSQRIWPCSTLEK